MRCKIVDVRVSLGATPYVKVTVTADDQTMDIRQDVLQIAIASSEGPAASGPTAWATAEIVPTPTAPQYQLTGRVQLSSAWPAGDYFTFARLQDNPQTLVTIDDTLIRVS